jgi:hypothetical protein
MGDPRCFITEFTGEYQDFARWRTNIEHTLRGTGYDRILIDKQFSKTNSDMNSTMFTQLLRAVMGGPASRVMEDVEFMNGYAAWQGLIAWFEVLDVITRFQKYNQDNRDLEDGHSDQAKVQMFLKHIRKPRHKARHPPGAGSHNMTSTSGHTCDLGPTSERTTKRRYEGSASLTHIIARQYDPALTQEQQPSRRCEPVWCQQDSPPGCRTWGGKILVARMNRNGGKISVSRLNWMAASSRDKTIIQGWNRRLKKNEEPDHQMVPPARQFPPMTGEPIRPKTDDLQHTH